MMLLSKAVRDKHFEALVEKLIALIPEQLLRLRIYEYNLALRIDDNHRIGRSIEEISE
jgi:ribonuclease HIII